MNRYVVAKAGGEMQQNLRQLPGKKRTEVRAGD